MILARTLHVNFVILLEILLPPTSSKPFNGIHTVGVRHNIERQHLKIDIPTATLSQSEPLAKDSCDYHITPK